MIMEVQKINAQTAIVHLVNAVDIEDSQVLAKILQLLYDEGVLVIHLDFAMTRFMRKSCLGQLIFFQKKLKDRGGELKIVNVRGNNVRHLFDMLEISKIISIEGTDG
jgi:anti-sigma B factor antagonist